MPGVPILPAVLSFTPVFDTLNPSAVLRALGGVRAVVFGSGEQRTDMTTEERGDGRRGERYALGRTPLGEVPGEVRVRCEVELAFHLCVFGVGGGEGVAYQVDRLWD